MGYRRKFCLTKQRKKCLCGLGCVAAGILVLICFLPDWLFALVLAGVCFWLGVSLLGIIR